MRAMPDKLTSGCSLEFEVGDRVVYRGKTYWFPGVISGITNDGQIVVTADGRDDGAYKGMKHIFGPSQLQHAK